MLFVCFQFVGYTMLNLDVNILVNRIDNIRYVKLSTFVNVYITKILRLFKSRKGWILHTFFFFFGNLLMIEDHKQMGNLISVFQKYFLFGFAQMVLDRALFFLNSQNVALIFLHRFPCSVEPMTFIFLFFQDSLPGISHYVYLTYGVVVLENTHLINQTLLFQPKVFDTIHTMIFFRDNQ